MSLSMSSCGKMTLCSLRKIIFRLLCELHSTSKPCAATIAAKFMPEALRKLGGDDTMFDEALAEIYHQQSRLLMEDGTAASQAF
jgi:hypothetical protein